MTATEEGPSPRTVELGDATLGRLAVLIQEAVTAAIEDASLSREVTIAGIDPVAYMDFVQLVRRAAHESD